MRIKEDEFWNRFHEMLHLSRTQQIIVVDDDNKIRLVIGTDPEFVIEDPFESDGPRQIPMIPHRNPWLS